MGLIQVEPGQLDGASSEIAAVGRRVSELGASARSKFCLASPPQTSASLNAFQVRWSELLHEMGRAVETLGLGLGMAATAYRHVDTTAMPSGSGTPR